MPAVAAMVNTQPRGSEPLPDLRMSGVAYRQVHFHPPFGASAPPGDDWRLYLIGGGEVLFEAEDARHVRQILPAGSVVAVSGAVPHRFASPHFETAGLPDAAWVERPLARHCDPGTVVITMGRIAHSRMEFIALFEPVVVFPADRHPELVARFARAIDWIVDESFRSGPESEEIIRRLAEITTFEIGRSERESRAGRDRALFRAASDGRILRAITAFHSAPREKWSVERLAAIAGMSRTAFAVRYRELIGSTPVRSLREHRLQLAADQLGHAPGRAPVASAAKHAGYGSGTSFIRAFATEFGTTPGKLARAKR